jgi:hypothetical protein
MAGIKRRQMVARSNILELNSTKSILKTCPKAPAKYITVLVKVRKK